MRPGLYLALALYILRHEEVVAVPDGIAELGDPVAEDEDTGLVGELEVDVDVTVAVDEVVDVGVILYVALGVEDEKLAVFAHVGWLLAFWPLQS